ncbi:MAG: site-2 protease family protein [Candidatus Micrarchaeia archaeon]
MSELRDILISMVVLSLAVAIAFSGPEILLQFSKLARYMLIFIVIVGFGFVFHELGHRTVARAFGAFAKFRMWPAGLVLALLISFTGVVFAAPGAVYIYSHRPLSREQNGLISIAGPLVNIFLFFVFIVSALFFTISFEGLNAFYIGAKVNAFLAFFNLLPFFPLDGSKVIAWDRNIWIFAMIFAFLCFLV